MIVGVMWGSGACAATAAHVNAVVCVMRVGMRRTDPTITEQLALVGLSTARLKQ